MATGKLEELIASLTKNEKVYFKRWLPSTSKQKTFVALFNEIESNPAISTKQLIAKLGTEFTPKKLNTLKTHLWSSLLLSLRDYHRNNDLQLQFNSRSDGIKVLRLKGQAEAALHNATKLLAECEEIEMFPEALRAIEHIENIWGVQNSPVDINAALWADLYEKKERISRQMAESSKIRMFERQLKMLNDQLGVLYDADKHKELVSNLSIQLNQFQLSDEACFDARFRYYNIQATIATIFENLVNLEHWFEKVFTVLKENPIITSRYYTAFYIIVINNYVESLLLLGKFNPIPSLLKLMKAHQGENPALAVRDFYIYGSCSLSFHSATEDYHNGLKEWNQLRQNQPVYQDLYFEQEFTRFMTEGAVICFWNNDFKQALSVLRSLFKQLKRSSENETLGIARLLEIICNYELGDIDHTEHLIGTCFRKEVPSGSSQKLEALVVKTISNQLKFKEASVDSWISLVQNLEALREIPDEKHKLLRFDALKYARDKSLLTK